MAVGEVEVKKRRMNVFILLLYLVLALYFVNFPFNFLKIPEIITKYNNWIVFVAGILMLLGAVNYFKVKRY